jgi:hypothetical protein
VFLVLVSAVFLDVSALFVPTMHRTHATQIFSSGFENGIISDIFDLAPQPSTPSNMAVEISTAKAHSGTKSMFYHPNYGDPTNPPALSLPNLNTVYAKWWWWVPSTLEGGVAGHHAFRITKQVGNNFQGGGQLDTGMGAGGTNFTFSVLTDLNSRGLDLYNLFNVPQNQWFQFEILTTLNTVGQSNGILKVWINGNVVYNNTNLVYRTDPSWRYNTFLAVTNIDGSSAASYWYMDDMEIWDGEPSGDTTPPGAPTGLGVS